MGYQIIRALLYFFFSLYGLHVEGRENIPDKGAVLFRNPLFGRLIRYLGAFPVKRNSADMTAIRRSLAELKKGQVLCIFPEGGFVHGKALGRFHPGMAFLAILTGTPILPVAIIGAEPLPVKKGPLAVVIGKPIPVRKARPDDRNTAALDELVKQRIQAMIEDYGRKKG